MSSLAAKSRSARPVTSSLTPAEYMSAVSKKLIPLSPPYGGTGAPHPHPGPTGATSTSRNSCNRGRPAKPSTRWYQVGRAASGRGSLTDPDQRDAIHAAAGQRQVAVPGGHHVPDDSAARRDDP